MPTPPCTTLAAGAALAAVLAGGAVTALRARKRLTWAVDLDMPVELAPGRSPDTDWTMIFAEHQVRPGVYDRSPSTS